jgi:hypothetical protein
VSVSLRQSHGFEGALAVWKVALPDRQAAPHPKQLMQRQGHRHTAARSVADSGGAYEQVFSKIGDFPRLNPQVFERF